MIKEVVQYKDFNGELTVDELYFNITEVDSVEIMQLQPRLETWSKRVSGEARELTVDEIQELLNIIKFLIDKSYGIRSDDGKKHRKSAEILDDFKSSAAYSAFIMGLFKDPTRAMDFMTGVMPEDIAEQARQLQAEASNGNSPAIIDASLPETGGKIQAVDEVVPAWEREDRDPTQVELMNMSRIQMQQAFRRRNERTQA